MKPFTFIDLFAGIGGFHLALHALGGTCVFASEIDADARKTYEYNLSRISPKLFANGMYNQDIRSISPEEIPDFDILCAGFPCQPFSQAGYKRGFNDGINSERGNLFFNIAEILAVKRPEAFFLENVRGLVSHDNGKTFKVIRQVLEEELGYSFYYKIVKACDYGLPQLRPRTFMIGFRDEGILKGFQFPTHKPLKYTMSDIFQGKCSRDIGFTLRVGGRGSNIDDRRNWDAYLVNGEVVTLQPQHGLLMQGFPKDFVFPVSKVQAMKQLGNSVAVDAVKACAEAMLAHLGYLRKGSQKNMVANTKNKGEWTELYAFLKILKDRQIPLSDAHLNITEDSDYIITKKISTLNIAQECILLENDSVLIKNKITGETQTIKISDYLTNDIFEELRKEIITNSGTFAYSVYQLLEGKFGITIIKGGNSNQKSDIVLDFENCGSIYTNQGFGIKSYLGAKPTLLNASLNTNFIFKVDNINEAAIDQINSEDVKLKQRLKYILDSGGSLIFHKIERDTMDYNVRLIDSQMPELLAAMMLEFYLNRTANISENLSRIIETSIVPVNSYNNIQSYTIKIKRFLVATLLGSFAGTKWDGTHVSNGLIVVKKDGSQVAFHIIKQADLESYLFSHIKFDTPSTTRHRYGTLYKENGTFYFKLNLQLRF